MVLSHLMPDRYSADNLRRVLENPRLLRLEAIGIATRFNARTTITLESKFGGPDGVDVIARDWDNLLILDGCRYDLFANGAEIEGNLRKVRSKASHSGEFMEANFEGRQLHDTVYVTANPHAYDIDKDVFHAVENLLDDKWDERTQTVSPGAVVQTAVDVHERYPEKRLIVHFMQPHFPFLGDTGREFSHRGIDMHREETGNALNPWLALVSDPELSLETVLKAYEENLEIVVPHVEELVRRLSGKSVVTSDHGNLIGERGFPIPVKQYGHPRGVRNPGVLDVPWLEIPARDRRRTVAEPPICETKEHDQAAIEERLRALGYA